MAYSGTTTHYGLPKYVSTDKPSWLDTNDGFDAIDQALYAAAQAIDPAQIAQMQNDITTLQTSKQNVLTFDAAPTNGSVNPVTSGGVYTALQPAVDIVSIVATDTYGSVATKIKNMINPAKLTPKTTILDPTGGCWHRVTNDGYASISNTDSRILIEQMFLNSANVLFNNVTAGTPPTTNFQNIATSVISSTYVGDWEIWY